MSENTNFLFSKITAAGAAKLLELHYSYIEKPVTCNEVKPFLPGLADPALEIHVPTPITAHIDNCQECKNDLKTLQKFNLTHKQLGRLGQLFSDKSIKNSPMCIEVQKAIPFAARLDFEGLPSEIINHLCLCGTCRKQVTDFRNKHMQRISKIEQKQPFACEEVMARDIFDFAIPYGLDVQNNQNANSNKLFIAHIANCSDCFKKLRDLSDTVFEILARPKSDTVTKFRIDTSNEDLNNDSAAYQGRPILVEVTHKANAWTRIEKRFSTANLTQLIKPVAAVLLFALVLYIFTMPAAHAIALEDIYNAVAKVANVHISRFVPDKPEPIQQQWVSQSLRVLIIKSRAEIAFWDINNHIKKTKYLATGIVDVNSFSNGSALKLSKIIDKTSGLLPFSRLSDIPENVKWQKVDDNNYDPNEIKVYDLLWTEKSTTDLVRFKKWRAFLDARNYLPQRIEWFEKQNNSDEYILKSYSIIEYPGETQIQSIIRSQGL